MKVEQALKVTDTVLVIIGPDWLRLLNERQEPAATGARSAAKLRAGNPAPHPAV
jgi:hypothetical protein